MNVDRRQVGIIGVDLLGRALADRLIKQGFAVSGFDVETKRLDDLRSVGSDADNSAVIEEIRRQATASG